MSARNAVLVNVWRGPETLLINGVIVLLAGAEAGGGGGG